MQRRRTTVWGDEQAALRYLNRDCATGADRDRAGIPLLFPLRNQGLGRGFVATAGFACGTLRMLPQGSLVAFCSGMFCVAAR